MGVIEDASHRGNTYLGQIMEFCSAHNEEATITPESQLQLTTELDIAYDEMDFRVWTAANTVISETMGTH
jgi:hypothetical protein